MRTSLLWSLWIIGTLAIAGAFAARLYLGGDRTTFLPGETAGVHHQIELACETCHTSDDFSDQKKITKDINKTCVTCHKEELKEANDSHPIKKFKNPRMASYWDKVDARFCTSCHMEHQPEVTLAGLVTLPGDFCVACHSEGDQDVRKNRPSHADLEFDTCASSGCHNFHDNRALYEDYLVKHSGQPWLSQTPTHAAAAVARQDQEIAADTATYLAALDAPLEYRNLEIGDHWAASAHAVADVGCASCHAKGAKTPEEIEAEWVEFPDEAVCASCHKAESKTFALGRHGMRRHPKIAKPRKVKNALKDLGWKKPPAELVDAIERFIDDPSPEGKMSTAEARVELHPDMDDLDLTCASCHKPHEQDLKFAAVDACLTCHADDHSQSYKQSPHFALWQAEIAGDMLPGSGVTCATCHMPQTERGGKVTTNHNQNDTLRPNAKMIRPVCMDCHSLEFAIDALADPELIKRNFLGKPDRHVESIDWALRRVAPPEKGANQ
jgi:predicted CXXCH cytochrome family protein